MMRLSFLSLAWKNLARNRTRTLLTVAGVTVAVTLFTFFYTLDASLNVVLNESSGKQNLIVQQEGHW
ncbi:MAG: hypothetical protein RDV41_08465 [Planctomycetota bacterium]|nr:hypothetical protein [Planctomycetota bacterium]